MAQDPNAPDAGGDEAAATAESEGVTAEQAMEMYNKLTGQPHAAQANYFLNVYWEQFSDQRDTVVAIFEKFCDSGEDKSSISAIAFMKVLQDLEDDYPLINSFGGTSGVADKFAAVGIKKKGEIPILGALLAIFKTKLIDTVNLPATPCNAGLINAQKNLEKKENEPTSLEQKIITLKAEIETITGAVKLGAKRTELSNLERQPDTAGKAQKTKDINLAKKQLKEAQDALEQENLTGTDATNWFKEQCTTKHKRFVNFDL